MAGTDILKTIKINVDSKEYQALLKSMAEIKKLELEINKLSEKSADVLASKKLKALEKIHQLTEKLNRLNKSGSELEQKAIRADIVRQQNLVKKYDLQIKLSKLQEKQNKLEKEAQQVAAKRALEREKINYYAEQRRAKLRGEDRPSGYRIAQQIQNFRSGGGFELLGDISQRKGEKTVQGIENQIFEKEHKFKENELEINRLIEERFGEDSDKLSTSQKSALTKRINILKKENEGIQEEIEGEGGLKDVKASEQGKTKAQVAKFQAMAQAASKIANQLNRVASFIGNTLTKPFKDLAEKVKGVITEMTQLETGVATYNMSTSLITNAAAREQQLRYGLSSSQNYAFTKAKSLLNIQSDEDLMYMNKEQRDRLLSYMERYSSWYDEMESSGVLKNIQEMQLEFNELKEELAMEFLSWIAENKETIMVCIKGIFEVIKTISNLIMSFVSFITAGKTNTYDLYEKSNASDTYNNNNSRNTNITINANTTNNATGVLSSKDALDKYNEDNWSNLAKQIVSAIGG